MSTATPTLLGMPPEIRLQIYAHLYSEVKVPVERVVNTSGIIVEKHVSRDYPTALSKTCRHLRDESVPAFYSHITLTCELRKDGRWAIMHGLFHHLEQLGEENVRRLRHFEIRWEQYADISFDLTRYARKASKKDGTVDDKQVSPPLVLTFLRMMSMPNSAAMRPTPVARMRPLRSGRGRQWIAVGPPFSTRPGDTHIVTVTGLKYAGYDREGLSRLMDMPKFCEVMADEVSEILGELLDGGLRLGIKEFVRFCRLVDGTASGKRRELSWP